MDPVLRNDPNRPDDAVQMTPMERTTWYLRIAGAMLGVMLILFGLILAVNIFFSVKSYLDEPDRFSAYIAAWEADVPPAKASTGAEVEPEPVPVAATESDPETSPQDRTEIADLAAATEPDPPEPNQHPAGLPPKRVEDDSGFTPLINSIERFITAIYAGGAPWMVGAVFLVLFALLLIKIPIALIRCGIVLLSSITHEDGGKRIPQRW